MPMERHGMNPLKDFKLLKSYVHTIKQEHPDIKINPRYGGGAPLSMKAGARSAEALLTLLSGDVVEY